MSHTPGPWLYRGKSCSVYTGPTAGTAYQYGAFIFGFSEVAEPEDDDLVLILAAPDLLKALKDVHPYIEGDELRKRIGAVISKAEGLTP